MKNGCVLTVVLDVDEDDMSMAWSAAIHVGSDASSADPRNRSK